MHTRVLVALVMAALAAKQPFDEYAVDDLFNEAKIIVKRVRVGVDEDGNFEGDEKFNLANKPRPRRRKK